MRKPKLLTHNVCVCVFFLVYVVWMICKTKIKVQTHYRWAYLFFNSVLACIQHSNRFLLQIPAKGSTINIYWQRGCTGSVAVCPGAEGCFCVCVCTHLVFSLHRGSIVMFLACCSNIWLGAFASSPAWLSLKTSRRKTGERLHPELDFIWNVWIGVVFWKGQNAK